jgi:polygalacturonase
MFRRLSVLSAVVVLVQAVCDVTDYGAVGDGITNDTTAILRAISTCSQSTSSRTVVFPPKHNFATWPLDMSGSQWSNMTYVINGNLTNLALPSSWPGLVPSLLMFKNSNNVTITGQGWLDGMGEPWWTIRKVKSSAFAPRLIQFDDCDTVSTVIVNQLLVVI